MQKKQGTEDWCEVKNRCLIVHIGKELDHHNAILLKEKADRYIEKENVKHIIFDFKNAEFMDSSGIGVIMGRYKKVIFTGGKVYVACVGRAVDRIFQISGLYKIVEKKVSVEDALADGSRQNRNDLK